MNKKAVELGAGIGIVAIIAYFIFFIFIVAAVENFENGLNNNINSDSRYSSIVSNIPGTVYSFCDHPREKYVAGGELTKFSLQKLSSLECSQSKGISSQTMCEDINGCSWDFISCDSIYDLWVIGWVWTGINGACDTTYKSCIGTIDAESYGIKTTSDGKDVADFNYEGDHTITEDFTIKFFGYTIKDFYSDSICRHPKVLKNKELCEKFSCTWNEQKSANYDESFISNTKMLISLTSDIFTFEYDWGFKNKNINIILYCIFILLPLILLIVFIYMAIR